MEVMSISSSSSYESVRHTMAQVIYISPIGGGNRNKYLALSKEANNVFIVQVSTISSDLTFSTSGGILHPCQHSLWISLLI
jgi:hypothetical protein